MPRTANTSSSRRTSERLLRVPFARLHPHPLNSNEMSAAYRAKLKRNIEREQRYPPLIVRPHPDIADSFQILDGHQRAAVLEELGQAEGLCFVWECDDETALLLLATLNRLEGEDLPARRSALLAELAALLPFDLLAELVSEDARAIEESIALSELDSASLLAELTAAAARAAAQAPRLISFAVSPEDELVIEAAVASAGEALAGPNRRGRALAIVCRTFMEGFSA